MDVSYHVFHVGAMSIYAAVDGVLRGVVAISDSVRPEARLTVENLFHQV